MSDNEVYCGNWKIIKKIQEHTSPVELITPFDTNSNKLQFLDANAKGIGQIHTPRIA